MTIEEMLGVAEIVERAAKRYNEQAARFREKSAAYDRLIAEMNADHERKLTEHRDAFGARTEADRQIIEKLRADLAKEREEHQEDVGHLNGEIVRFHGIADDLCNRLNSLGIKAAKQAGEALGMVEGEGLRAAAQRVVKERDALRTECDDLRRVFSLVHGSLGIQQGEHIGNAIDALKKERDELATRLRQSIARGDFAEMRLATLAAELETERDGLMVQVQDQRAEIERLREEIAEELNQSLPNPTPKRHPVKVGEWVRKTTDGLMYKIGDTFRLESYEIKDGQIWCNLDNGASWLMSVCEPCDPPEASHDTPAGKEAAEAAAKDDIKVGDVVEVVSASGGQTWMADVGSTGKVRRFELIDSIECVRLQNLPGKRNALGGYVSLCDVRKVPQ